MASVDQLKPFSPNEALEKPVYLFPTIDPKSEEIIKRLSFADTAQFTRRLKDYKGNVYGTSQVIAAVDDNDGFFEFEDSTKQALFERVDVGIREFSYYVASLAAIDSVSTSMPQGGLADGVSLAAKAKVTKLLSEQRQLLLNPQTTPDKIESTHYAQRDLAFALMAISSALNLGLEEYYVNDSYAWYDRGAKWRNGGYSAEYAVCNDEIDADNIDHAAQIEQIGDDELWPDEFHYPGKLEIRVNPAVRIEFIYTPEIESASNRHASHTTVMHDGRSRVYDNNSLSIRIDLDPNAPYGVALDIGRSAYDGGKNGRHITRDSDLLGGVFEGIDEQGSHEYTGFDESSRGAFRNFAERLAVQLDLQNKNVRAAKLGKAVLPKVA